LPSPVLHDLHLRLGETEQPSRGQLVAAPRWHPVRHRNAWCLLIGFLPGSRTDSPPNSITVRRAKQAATTLTGGVGSRRRDAERTRRRAANREFGLVSASERNARWRRSRVQTSGHQGLGKEGKIMNIIDTATVSALVIVLAVAVFATMVTFGLVVRSWVADRPARPARVRRPAVAVSQGRWAH
jgi:hypothetical protein